MPSFIEREQQREFQPYQSSIDQIARTFQTKLEYWKQGASQVKSAYQNYLGFEVTNPNNQEGLAEYMKTAKQEIQKASNLDFSVGENTSKILGVFDNLTNGQTSFSKNILADHSITESWNNSLQKAESSRYEDKGKDFNQASLNAIQRQKELYRQGKGTLEESRIASSMLEKYTPYYNTLDEDKKLTELFEADINDKTTPNGQGYLIHQKDASWKADKLREFIQANATDKYKQQIALEGRSDFYNHKLIAKQDPTTVVNAYQDIFNRSNQSEIQRYQQKVIDSNANILKLDSKDPEYEVKKNVLTQNVKSYQDSINSVNQRKFNPDLILGDDYREGVTFAQELNWNQKVNNFAQSFAHQNTVEETKMDQGYFATQNLALARTKFNFDVAKDTRDFAYEAAKDDRNFSYTKQKDYTNQLLKLYELGVTPTQDFLNAAKAAGVTLEGNLSSTSNTLFQPAGTSTQNYEGEFNSDTGEFVYNDGHRQHMIDYQRDQISDIDKNIQNSYRDGIIGAFASLGNFGNMDAEKVEAQLKMNSSPTGTTQWSSVGKSGYSSGAIRMFSKILNTPEASINTMTNAQLATQVDKLFTSKDGHDTLKKMIENGQIPNLDIGSFTSNINRQQALKKALAEDSKTNIAKALSNIGIQTGDIDDNLLIPANKLRDAFRKDVEWRNVKGNFVSFANSPEEANELTYQKWYKEKVSDKLRSKEYTDSLDPKTYQQQMIKMSIGVDKNGKLTNQSKPAINLVNPSLYDYEGSGGLEGSVFQPIVRDILTSNPQLVSEWIVDGQYLKPKFNREAFGELVKKGNPNDKDATTITLSGIELSSERLNAMEQNLRIPIKKGTELSSQVDPLKINLLRLSRPIDISIEGDYDNKYRISVGNRGNTSQGNNQEQSLGFELVLPSITFEKVDSKMQFKRDSQGNVIMETNSSENLKKTNPQQYQKLQEGIDITTTKTLDLLQQSAAYQNLLRDYLNSNEGKNIKTVEELPSKYKDMLKLIR